MDAFDNGARQLADAVSNSAVLHPVLRPLLSSLWTARNLEADRVQPRQPSPNHPHIQQEGPISAPMGGKNGCRIALAQRCPISLGVKGDLCAIDRSSIGAVVLILAGSGP